MGSCTLGALLKAVYFGPLLHTRSARPGYHADPLAKHRTRIHIIIITIIDRNVRTVRGPYHAMVTIQYYDDRSQNSARLGRDTVIPIDQQGKTHAMQASEDGDRKR